MSLTKVWISSRDDFESSAITAPEPAALPTEETFSFWQSGIKPRTVALVVSMWLPKAPASCIESI